jgi:hypothetical protein
MKPISEENGVADPVQPFRVNVEDELAIDMFQQVP